jgi:hypothetical protein
MDIIAPFFNIGVPFYVWGSFKIHQTISKPILEKCNFISLATTVLWERAQNAKAVLMQSENHQMRSMQLPVVNISKDEIKAYKLNRANKPKIDLMPTG